MPVVSGPAYTEVAMGLANELDMQYLPTETRRFPDGEGYLRTPVEGFNSMRSEPVIVVSSTFPDNGIVQTMMMLAGVADIQKGDLSNLKGEGVQNLDDSGRRILLAVPYYGYARQDKRFSAGEVIAAGVIADHLATACDGIVILDIHEPKVLESHKHPIQFVTAVPELSELLSKDVSPDFILSPDKGAIDRAKEVAEIIGVPYSYLEKKRIDAHTIEHTPKDLDVSGKVVAIVDDMISTGGTICRASDALRRQGATEVHAACTHGLFTSGALTRLVKHVDGVYSTDSLSNPRAVVSGAPALARGVKKLLTAL
ncbi:MAG: hypothetical protein CMA64_01065 [Euryarchaeota archaeon]|nr:hypothetical protein [Euryarchaeota archaeon]|tara:strand:- start:3515 stop:4450 length:936 start_codon:yes stop_codon:yes gene_type:complete